MSEELNNIALPVANEVQESTQAVETVNDTTNTIQQPETVIEQPKIKVKYNHEEKELSLEEASQYAQKGMNYDKVHEKATKLEQDYKIAREYGSEYGVYSLEDIARAYGNQGITTLEQFEKAVERQRMIDKGMDPDVVKNVVENDPDVKWAREERQRRETEQRAWKEFEDLRKDFEEIKNPEDIPVEVMQIRNERNCTYSDAMARYKLQQAKQKIDDLTKGSKTQEINSLNAQSSTGSVTGNGTTTGDVLTAEKVAQMSERDLAKNWKEVKKLFNMK